MRRSIELPAEVASPARARQFVTDALAGSVEAELADVAVLLVSELATNAVIHARSASVLSISHDDGRLRVELHDASDQDAVVAAADVARPGGRGMLLVDSLANRWGCEANGHGKSVWFELFDPSPLV